MHTIPQRSLAHPSIKLKPTIPAVRRGVHITDSVVVFFTWSIFHWWPMLNHVDNLPKNLTATF